MVVRTFIDFQQIKGGQGSGRVHDHGGSPAGACLFRNLDSNESKVS